MKKLLVAVLVLMATFIEIKAQKKPDCLVNRKSAGILLEYGLPYYYLPEGDNRYYALLIGGTFGLPIYKTSNFFNVSIEFYPHFGRVWVKECRFIEFGLNVRLSLNFQLSTNDILSAKIASGPHYMSCETEKQAKGFIFSDYYLLTYRRGFTISEVSFAFDFEFGYRHMSNAGIQEPNRSISNFIIGIGLIKTF